MSEIDDPRVPGIGTGVFALVVALLPAAWIGTYLISLGIPGTRDFTAFLLAAEPYALPILGAVAIVFGIAALWRDTRAGRIVAIIALALVVLQAAAIVALILL